MKYYYMLMNLEYTDYDDFLNDVVEPGWNSSCESAMLSVGLFEYIDDAFETARRLAQEEIGMNRKEDIDRLEESRPFDCVAIIFKDGSVSSYQVVKMEVHK
jgi:hypothetical protein